MKPIISPKELAAAIGVSESSCKRWADDGLIRTSRTAGGHRRIPIGEAIRFIRAMKAPVIRPDALGLDGMAAGAEAAASSEEANDRFFTFLEQGRGHDARGLLISLYLAGQSVAEIGDGPVRSAMERLGAMWRHDPAGVFVEHRGTDTCILAIQHLRALAQSHEPKLLALGGAPSGDPYMVPSLLVAATLEAEGFLVSNLGPDTPAETFRVAVERNRPNLVWVSFSSESAASGFNDEVGNLARLLEPSGVPLVLGGSALKHARIPPAQNVAAYATLTELTNLARQMSSPGGADQQPEAPSA